MVYTLFSLMFKVFFVAAAAYLLRRRGALTEQDQKSVTNVLMRFVVYFTVIMSSQQDFPWRRPRRSWSRPSMRSCSSRSLSRRPSFSAAG